MADDEKPSPAAKQAKRYQPPPPRAPAAKKEEPAPPAAAQKTGLARFLPDGDDDDEW